jgi:ATP-dependent helicase/nuclease subunit A
VSFTLTAEQARATDPTSSVWVAANAGSGKTHVLVERVVRLLLEGADPASILCITYTKAAAAEMSARLFNRLGSWASLDDQTLIKELENLGLHSVDQESLAEARRLFTRALETPGGLKIQTIHGFCEKLLHLFPVEAGLAPGFKILDNRGSLELRKAATQNILSAKSAQTDTSFHVSLNAIGDETNSESFARLLGEFIDVGGNYHPLFNSSINANSFALALRNAAGLELEEDTQAITAEIVRVDEAAYLRCATILKQVKKFGKHDTSAHMVSVVQSSNRLLALKRLFLTGDFSKFREALMAKDTIGSYPSTHQFVESERLRLGPLFDKLKLSQRIDSTTHLFNVAKPIFLQIEQYKKLQGVYDFNDLISRCASLLNNSRAANWVLYKLDASLKHILVDEAQDTNLAQWQIIRALTDEFYATKKETVEAPRTLFVVGDRKQSIFSFQGADVAAFNFARFGFAEKVKDSGFHFDDVNLTVSYRSTKQVLAAVDKVFPSTNPQRLGFAVDDFIERDHTTVRGDDPGVVEIWPLYESLESELEEPWVAPVDREPASSPRRRLARDIVVAIKSWIDLRFLDSEERNVKPQDVLILLQSRGPLFAMLIAELRKADIPVAGADRLRLLESLAIQDLLALLQWLLLSNDDYALACVLKSPFVPNPLSEDQLFEMAYDRETKTLWSRLSVKGDENSKLLWRLKKLSGDSGPFALLSQVMSSSRKAMIARLGAEAEDATDALLDQAMAYEFQHGPSIAGFLHWITAEETDVKRELEQDSGEVRLMTVHGAKGLEANIVFLADAGSIPKSFKTVPQILQLAVPGKNHSLPFWRATGKEKSSLQSKMDEKETTRSNAERNRLLYVAMTRACDELYICGTSRNGNPESGSWYETIADALEVNNGGRFGAEPVFTQSEILIPNDKAKLPSWILDIAPPEKALSRTYSLTGLLSRHSNSQSSYDVKTAKRGVAIHALLQVLPSIPIEKRENYVLHKSHNLGLDPLEAKDLCLLLNKPELAELFRSESRSEVELRGTLEDGKRVVGRVDRITVLPNAIYILDYKSDIHVPTHLTARHPYAQQMALYVLLLQQAYPMHKMHVALLWTQHAKIEWLSSEFLQEAREFTFTGLEVEAS